MKIREFGVNLFFTFLIHSDSSFGKWAVRRKREKVSINTIWGTKFEKSLIYFCFIMKYFVFKTMLLRAKKKSEPWSLENELTPLLQPSMLACFFWNCFKKRYRSLPTVVGYDGFVEENQSVTNIKTRSEVRSNSHNSSNSLYVPVC